jgi:uroporphyrinogen-III synthase
VAGRFTDVRLAEPARDLGAAAALAAAMLAGGIEGPVLYPCGDRRRDELIDRLTAAGLGVDAVTAYRTTLAAPAAARDALAGADVVVVASPSVARLTADAVGAGRRPALVAVGPTTSAAAAAAGWAPDVVADRPDAEAIARAVKAAR